MRFSSAYGLAADLPWIRGAALTGVAAIVMAAPVQAATLANWQFDPNTHQLVITVPKGVTPRYYLVAEPARIVLDVPNTNVGTVPLEQSYGGIVRQIRVAQFQPGLTRIVMELSPEAVLAPGQVELEQLEDSDANTQRWALRPLLVTDAPNPTTAQSSSEPAASANTATPSPAASTPTENPIERPADSSTDSPTDIATAPTLTTNETAQPAATPQTNAASTETPSSTTPSVSATPPAAAAPDSEADSLPPLEPGAVEIPEAAQSAPATQEVPAAPVHTASTETPDPPPPSTAETPQVSNQPSSEADSLPPLEPGAVEIPVEIAAPPSPTPAESASTSPSPENSTETPTEASTEPVAEANASVDQAETSSGETPAAPAVSAPAAPAVTVAPAASVTAVSQPLPIDFSTPLPANLANSAGTASALSLPSTGQAAIQNPASVRTTAAQTNSSPLSFPTPPSGAVNVPSIDTVATSDDDANQTAANQAATNQTATNQTDTPEPSSAQSSPPAQPAVPNAFPTPTAIPTAATPRTTSAQPTSPQPTSPQLTSPQSTSPQPAPAQPVPAQPTAVEPSTLSFGQPIPVGQSSRPAGNLSGRSSGVTLTPVNNTIPFGQPIPAPSTPPQIEVIPFGQPLPNSQSSIRSLPNRTEVTSASVLIPSGTVLKLRYPGQSALELADRPLHQDVLLLEEPVHDRAGNVIIPAGSPVTGHFETNENGSQFVAQSVQLQGRSIALLAESDQLSGGRQVQETGLFRNSALGAVAGTLLGAVTGIGLIPAVLAGAATSAATTYVTSAQGPAIIQPNQVVEVRLTEDLAQ